MSSHREAPYISTDPVADNTDVYAFVSPDDPDMVTIIANFIPLEAPAGGPNFYQFGTDVRYEINISNSGKQTDISYQFNFSTAKPDPAAGFLYNTGPITSLTDKTWNRKQTYDVSVVKGGGASRKLGSGLACPPCNIGPLSTPNYSALAGMAVHTLATGEKVFAGQRADAFFVDLGAVFDLADLRPFANLHAGGSLGMSTGINTLASSNVHSIAVQVPKSMLTADGSKPTDPGSAKSVIGVYASASRQKTRLYNSDGTVVVTGPYQQVSRLGMPLSNEVLIGLGMKDKWNASSPFQESQFVADYSFPALADLLPSLYPGVFPHLKKLNAKLKGQPSAKQRADIVAIFLTGLPSGIVPGFQNNTGTTQADLLRLNMAIPPAAQPNPGGLVAGDAAGFPNGRRLQDDIVTIELRALAGVTYALVDKSYSPDAAASKVTDGSPATANLLSHFPYMPEPYSGYATPAVTVSGSTGGKGEPMPGGAPHTGGGGAAGLSNRAPLAAGAAGVAAVGAATAVAARKHLAGAGAHSHGADGPAVDQDAAGHHGGAAGDGN